MLLCVKQTLGKFQCPFFITKQKEVAYEGYNKQNSV